MNIQQPTLRFPEFVARLQGRAFGVEAEWRPVLFTLEGTEHGRLRAAAEAAHLEVVDSIEHQVFELAQIEYPSPGQGDERRAFVHGLRDAHGSLDAYGTWVYFAWLNRLVHVLPADAYHALITSRNHDKITVPEQALLRTRRVGVIGLSVGGEAAVTIAQEHLCGELVIADFDALDLSNMNRLQAGVDELGLNKAHIIARRVARIDPYLPVTVFAEGVTLDNISSFVGGLDLLVEECDGLSIKYAIREECRLHRVNIVYAADERGFLSVEPYAQLPQPDLFHGRITEMPLPRNSHATSLAYYKALAEWIGGWDNLSERSRISLQAINTRLCGYPQLASEARLAAGLIGHVARLLLIGTPMPPSLTYVDLDTLIARL